MPRGGPDASWLNRKLQTTALEYTDRYDIADEVKQKVIQGLDTLGVKRGMHERNARRVLALVADIESPRILELGAGHGRLSEQILRLHSTARVTISDLDPVSVRNVAQSTLGADPRVTTKVVDATAIHDADNAYDLVVFAAAFHHLPPDVGYRCIAEATRVGRKFLVVDIKRPPTLVLAFAPLLMLTAAFVVKPSIASPLIHDGYISMLRSYSPDAFTALAKAADPAMMVEFDSSGRWNPFMSEVVVAFSRRNHVETF